MGPLAFLRGWTSTGFGRGSILVTDRLKTIPFKHSIRKGGRLNSEITTSVPLVLSKVLPGKFRQIVPVAGDRWNFSPGTIAGVAVSSLCTYVCNTDKQLDCPFRSQLPLLNSCLRVLRQVGWAMPSVYCLPTAIHYLYAIFKLTHALINFLRTRKYVVVGDTDLVCST